VRLFTYRLALMLLAATPAAAQSTGIPACDAWMKARRACLDAGPEEARQRGYEDLQTQADEMRRDGGRAEARRIYTETCTAMLPITKQMIDGGLCSAQKP